MLTWSGGEEGVGGEGSGRGGGTSCLNGKESKSVVACLPEADYHLAPVYMRCTHCFAGCTEIVCGSSAPQVSQPSGWNLHFGYHLPGGASGQDSPATRQCPASPPCARVSKAGRFWETNRCTRSLFAWVFNMGHASYPPGTPCPNTGQVLVQEAKARRHRVAVFGQARVTARDAPRNTCCRHAPTLPLHDYKRGSTRSAYTPDPNTLLPHGPFLQPAQSDEPHWVGTAKRWFQKRPKKAKTRGHRVCMSLC